MQYVGSTTDPFLYRWNSYKDKNRKAERGVEHMQADLFRLSNNLAIGPPRISPLKIQRGSIFNDLTQGDESLSETLEPLCDNNKDHSEERYMKASEINGLEKRLGFSPTKSFMKETDLGL